MADSDEENTFIKLGTPLEEIDEGKLKQIWTKRPLKCGNLPSIGD